MMNKLNPDDPLVQELLNDPRVVELRQQLTDFIIAEYARFDETEFVGEASGGAVKAVYCFGKKGFVRVEVADSTYADKTYTCDALPLAMNDSFSKYGAELKAVEQRVIDFEKELYVKMATIAMERVKDEVKAPTPAKKTYLN
jgi:DNA-binding protein YbaB